MPVLIRVLAIVMLVSVLAAAILEPVLGLGLLACALLVVVWDGFFTLRYRYLRRRAPRVPGGVRVTPAMHRAERRIGVVQRWCLELLFLLLSKCCETCGGTGGKTVYTGYGSPPEQEACDTCWCGGGPSISLPGFPGRVWFWISCPPWSKSPDLP